MSRLRRLLLALPLLCLPHAAVSAQTAQGPQGTPAPPRQEAPDNSAYRRLVERAKRGDPTVDFVKMRDAFLDWVAARGSRADAPNRDAMVEAFKKQDYAKAVELAEVVLDYEFTHRGLHLATEDAYRKLGNEAKANYHRDIAQKLLQALLTTGDGKSPKTAYRVHSIREEYQIMAELGYQVHSQSLMTHGDTPYDMLTGKHKETGKEVSLYFDISSFFGGGRRGKK